MNHNEKEKKGGENDTFNVGGDVNDIAKCLLPHQIENRDKEIKRNEKKKKQLAFTYITNA